ncbi:hypothetical protein [Chryseobacterium limigenitum]|uniref:Uncharacterized protein n=1 Tax=Chryseobacterium limigenitum TaxID=1612149 RepID=A0A1K2IS96_9FLAO|nr:hypothetical protein [Chryseobacterium limigenitum]SFZ95305.1 hypothetical protein SAMN05216324_10955 [Chryseobacterium limigenitum]
MKKTIKLEKKLSLKKLQIMKVSEMKTLNGGTSQLININGGDEPPTLVPQNTVSVRA